MLSALTTEDELVTLESDPFDWGRFTAEQSDTSLTLATKLDGWFGFARELWRTLRKCELSKTIPFEEAETSIAENGDIPTLEPELVDSR